MNHSLLYIPKKELICSHDLGEYESFGISVLKNNTVLSYVSDVSVDEQFILELAQRCTSGQLDPIHLYDVIEDSLNT